MCGLKNKHEADYEIGCAPSDCISPIVTGHLDDHGHTDGISGEDGDLSDVSATTLNLAPLGRAAERCVAGSHYTADEVGGDDKASRAFVDACPDDTKDTDDANEHYKVETKYPPE